MESFLRYPPGPRGLKPWEFETLWQFLKWVNSGTTYAEVAQIMTHQSFFIWNNSFCLSIGFALFSRASPEKDIVLFVKGDPRDPRFPMVKYASSEWISLVIPTWQEAQDAVGLNVRFDARRRISEMLNPLEEGEGSG